MADQGLEHIPTADTRAMVKTLKMIGRLNDDIALALDIDDKTLTKHYPDELKQSIAFLEKNASQRMMELLSSEDENVAFKASSFLLRMKCRWKEDRSIDNSDGLVGLFDSMIQARAEQMLKEKEAKHEY